KRRNAGADGEVWKLAELLNTRDRVDAHLLAEEQQRLRADGKIGIAEHLGDDGADCLVAARAQNRQRTTPDLRVVVMQQPVKRPPPDPPRLLFDNRQGVADGGRIVRRQLLL